MWNQAASNHMRVLDLTHMVGKSMGNLGNREAVRQQVGLLFEVAHVQVLLHVVHDDAQEGQQVWSRLQV